jgi:DNA-binding MarR family transcriptional regulator
MQSAGLPETPGAGTGMARLTDAEHDIWRSMISVHARLVANIDSELQAASGISLRDYEVLVQLSEVEGGALRMAELADLLIVSPSGLTRRLDGLVKDGLVKRQACMSDRRGTLAVLSPAGWEVLEHAAPTHVAAVRRYLFDVFDREQLAQWTSCVQAMSAALGVTDRSGTADTRANSLC